MCVVSMVHDHYQPLFPKRMPWIQPIQPNHWPLPSGDVDFAEALERLEQLIKDFKNARDAAIVVDKLTGQPDCVDPEKAKLEERVAKLEKEIAEFKKQFKEQKRRADMKPMLDKIATARAVPPRRNRKR